MPESGRRRQVGYRTVFLDHKAQGRAYIDQLTVRVPVADPFSNPFPEFHRTAPFERRHRVGFSVRKMVFGVQFSVSPAAKHDLHLQPLPDIGSSAFPGSPSGRFAHDAEHLPVQRIVFGGFFHLYIFHFAVFRHPECQSKPKNIPS